MLSGKALKFLVINLSALQLSIQNGALHNVCKHVWQSQNWHWCPANDTRTAEDKTVVFANLGEVSSLSSLSSTCKNTGHSTVLWLLIYLHDKLSTLRESLFCLLNRDVFDGSIQLLLDLVVVGLLQHFLKGAKANCDGGWQVDLLWQLAS
jgi:hypothetical protein